MQCRIDNKVPFWELLRVIGACFNFDGEADLEVVEDAPNDDEDEDDDDTALMKLKLRLRWSTSAWYADIISSPTS